MFLFIIFSFTFGSNVKDITIEQQLYKLTNNPQAESATKLKEPTTIHKSLHFYKLMYIKKLEAVKINLES
jgi:hypothetical protein